MRRQEREEPASSYPQRRAEAGRRLVEVSTPGQDVSLHLKILAGYVVLGVALAALYESTWGFPWWVRALLAAILTLVLGLVLPSLLARVTRVKHLSRSALEISRGDLSKPVDDEQGSIRDEIDELSEAITTMQENLRELVGHIQRTAHSVSDQAGELTASAEGVNASNEQVGEAMGHIASGAGRQRELVGHARAVITEMAGSIQKTAVTAEDAARASAETSSSAEDGSRVAGLAGIKVNKVFSRIESASKEVFAFGEKTQEISKIVDAITQVAHRTNMLALNATIEAARAGEYGRGFAVVADEVRKLAESAGKSAEQISKLARDISGQSAAVVTAMREGIDELAEGRADLTSIVKSMTAVTDTARKGAEKVALISESARQQLAGSEDMVRAIAQISQVAEANAAATDATGKVMDEQTAAVARMTSAAQELQNLSAELQDVVSRFRLGR